MDKEENKRMELGSLPKKTKSELKNVSNYLGISMSDFIRMSIRKELSSYPENIRNPIIKD